MSAADIHDGYTKVLLPRPSGMQHSGLYAHLLRKQDDCLDAINNGNITSVKRPAADPLLPGAKYFLLNLNSKLIQFNLFDYLPNDIKGLYHFGKHQLHIRIDRDYGYIGSKIAAEHSFWYSHITLQVSVGDNKYLACHIYVDEGVVRAISIKTPEGKAFCAEGVLISKAHEIAKEPLKILCHAIKHMQDERYSLETQLKDKVDKLCDIKMLNTLSKQKLDELLLEAKKLQDLIISYSEGYYANDFKYAERFVKERRGEVVALQRLYITETVQQEAATREVSASMSTTFEPSSFGQSISISPVSGLLALDKPSELELEKMRLIELKARFDKLQELSKEYKETKLTATSVSNVYKYYFALQCLRVDVAAADICASETNQATASKLHECTNKLLSKEILDFYVQQLNVEGIKRFFAEFKSQLDWTFYLAYQARIMHSDMSDAEEDSAVEICEFFFKHDLRYRGHLSGAYKSYRNDNEDEVSILLIVLLIWRASPRTKLFTCIVKHSGAQKLEGFVSKDRHAASLLFVACACSSNDNFGEVISALLDTVNPCVEVEAELFAKGVKTELIDVFVTMASVESEKFTRCNATFSSTLYMGSALYAYMTAGDVRLDITYRLMKATSIMHLMLAFSRFCMGNVQQLNYCSTEKFGIDIGIEVTVTEKIRLAQNAAMTGGKHYACLIGSGNPDYFSMLETLYLEVKSRLSRMKEQEFQDIITKLQRNAQHFETVQNHGMALSCYQAILYFSMYLSPSENNHRLIATTCLNLCDATACYERSHGKAEMERLAKLSEGYAEAMKFLDTSIYKNELQDLKTSSRVKFALCEQSSVRKSALKLRVSHIG